MNDKTRILFVCLGNIIRSPLAEHMFAHLAEKAGVADKYFVDSAGTSAYHIGEQPDSRMRRVAAQNGLQYDGRAKQFQEDDYDRFDFIIPQDQDNLRNLRWLARGPADEAKLFTMRTFDPLGSSNEGVPDPYYGGADGFQTTFEIVRRSCQGLLDALEKGELA
ncbi:MAG: low molecular weight phosphotyrosine protein phosphatase [Anaerolineales bacterium]|jgi:protein-tyrosine phosphatase